MNHVINLFKATKGVWNVSRWLLIPLFFSSVLKGHQHAPMADNIVNGSSLIFVILLLVTLSKNNRNDKYLKLRFVSGSFAVFYRLIMAVFISRLAEKLD